MRDTAGVLPATTFHATVADRFGVLPNFFTSALGAPGLIEQLWLFALAAYLDNPLPSLFKERLFVFLSQFCAVRYCIVRHVGFLLGLGRPAGDAASPLMSVDEVIALLQRPRPDMAGFEQSLARLLAGGAQAEMPASDTPFERDLFNALMLLFLTPLAGGRARDAVRAAVGDERFEYLAAFLAFVRTAHYWTETHPEIEIEADMLALMQANQELAGLLLTTHAQA